MNPVDETTAAVEETTPPADAATADGEEPVVARRQVPMLMIPLPAGTDFNIQHLENGGRRIVVGPIMVAFSADFEDPEACRAFGREMSAGIEIASALDDATRAQADRLLRETRG